MFFSNRQIFSILLNFSLKSIFAYYFITSIILLTYTSIYFTILIVDISINMGVYMYDALTATKMLNAFVPISRFNKGEAGKIIEEVKRDGIKVIVKNNAPECVMITVEDYDKLVLESKRVVNPPQTLEQEKARKEFIEKIRKNVAPPLPPTRNRKEVMDEIGPIEVDKDAVWELRRMSMI